MPVAMSPSDVFMFVICLFLLLLMALTLPTEADKGTAEEAAVMVVVWDNGTTMPEVFDAPLQP